MSYKLIDMKTWPRAKYFEHFLEEGFNNTYSMTVKIDITNLMAFIKSNGYKFYPTLVYIINNLVNSTEEMRLDFDSDGKLICYDETWSEYALFNNETKCFVCANTPYKKSFKEFYKNMTADMEKYKTCTDIYAIPTPKHCFCISCVPWIQFEHINVNIKSDKINLRPIIIWSKYSKENSKYYLPISLTIHHSIADGYHTARFFNKLQELCNNPESILND